MIPNPPPACKPAPPAPDLEPLINPFLPQDVDQLVLDWEHFNGLTEGERHNFSSERHCSEPDEIQYMIDFDGIESQEQIRADPRIMLSVEYARLIIPVEHVRPDEVYDALKSPADMVKLRRQFTPPDVAQLFFDWRPDKWKTLLEAGRAYLDDGWLPVWYGWPKTAGPPPFGLTREQYCQRPISEQYTPEEIECFEQARRRLKEEARDRCEFDQCRQLDADGRPIEHDGERLISNCLPVDALGAIWGDTETRRPCLLGDLLAAIEKRFAGWPAVVGDRLFVVRQRGDRREVEYLRTPDDLFAWLGQFGKVDWSEAAGHVRRREFMAGWKSHTPRRYRGVEILPHEPAIAGQFYTSEIKEPGNGRDLEELLDFFAPETPVDRQLILAMFATPLWGGPPGSRPAFLITASSGRGRGKSRLAQTVARLYGGGVDVSPGEEIGKIKTRFLSAGATGKRVAVLDNIKSTRFSWGELESLITAGEISGHRLFSGEASLPNHMAWLLTLNGASLSTDMAERVVEVKLADPSYHGEWEQRLNEFVDANQLAILADLVGFLRRPEGEIGKPDRWGSWGRGVLSKVNSPAECLEEILRRRQAVDVEEAEGEIVESYFADKLTWLDYDPARDDVFLPSDLVRQWFNAATGGKTKAVGVSLILRQWRDEGKATRLVRYRMGGSGGRGFRWVGERCPEEDVTYYDVRKRLSQKREEREGGERKAAY